jgi:hypothetical protein
VFSCLNRREKHEFIPWHKSFLFFLKR